MIDIRVLLQLVLLLLLLLTIASHAFSVATRTKHQTRARRCYAEEEYRSISDYMGGHHAGKFDFDSRICGVTALNYEKSMVFDDVASQKKSKSLRLASIPDAEEVPKWAGRPVDVETALQGSIRVSSSPEAIDDTSTALLKNDELSWEPFYATIESSAGKGGDFGLTVSPCNGHLAPRGGSDPYSDSCSIAVTTTSSSSSPEHRYDLYLVVRTELDHWSWRVEF